MPAHDIVTAYQGLLRDAIATDGRIEPYLQQLNRFDAANIKSIEASQLLSDSIAIKALQAGMMSGLSRDEIKAKINPFVDPTETNSHGRSIGMQTARDCGLNVREIDLQSAEWKLLWEVYVRSDYYVSNKCSKLIETKKHHFEAPPAFVGGDD